MRISDWSSDVCSSDLPVLGSEPGFTWNWAWHLSERHDVWVIAHPAHRPAVEAALARAPERHVHMAWLGRTRWWDLWRPERGERGIHLHYLLWQKAAFDLARDLHARHRFDLVHHVSWGTVNAPPALWRLGPPFV